MHNECMYESRCICSHALTQFRGVGPWKLSWHQIRGSCPTKLYKSHLYPQSSLAIVNSIKLSSFFFLITLHLHVPSFYRLDFKPHLTRTHYSIPPWLCEPNLRTRMSMFCLATYNTISTQLITFLIGLASFPPSPMPMHLLPSAPARTSTVCSKQSYRMWSPSAELRLPGRGLLEG